MADSVVNRSQGGVRRGTPHRRDPEQRPLGSLAAADPSLTAHDHADLGHLATCDRCGPLVDELSMLRGALAELPDLAPSRPLRLIPPVAEPAARARGSWLRRLTGPAMAAGAGLVLVGAVGIASGSVGGLFGMSGARFENAGEDLQGAGASQKEAAASDNAYQPVPGTVATPIASSNDSRGSAGSPRPSQPASMGLSPGPSSTSAPKGTEGSGHLGGGSSAEQPWLTLLIAGASLFVISAGLRFSISPRAG